MVADAVHGEIEKQMRKGQSFIFCDCVTKAECKPIEITMEDFHDWANRKSYYYLFKKLGDSHLYIENIVAVRFKKGSDEMTLEAHLKVFVILKITLHT